MSVSFIFGILVLSLVAVEGKFKSLHCNLLDKQYGEFLECKIRAISRQRNAINVFYRQLLPINKAILRLEFFKRANGWRPFLYNITVDLCEMLQKNKNLIVNLAYAYIKPYLRLNYTCPLKANDWVRCENFELDFENLHTRFPVETGEYATQVTFYHRNNAIVSVNGSYEYSDYKAN